MCPLYFNWEYPVCLCCCRLLALPMPKKRKKKEENYVSISLYNCGSTANYLIAYIRCNFCTMHLAMFSHCILELFPIILLRSWIQEHFLIDLAVSYRYLLLLTRIRLSLLDWFFYWELIIHIDVYYSFLSWRTTSVA